MEFGREPIHIVRRLEHTSHAPGKTKPVFVKHTSSTSKHTSSWERKVDSGGTHTSQRIEINQYNRWDRVEGHQYGDTRPIEIKVQDKPPSERYINSFLDELEVNHSVTATLKRKPPPVPPRRFKPQIVEDPKVTNDRDPPLKAKPLQVPKVVASGKNLAIGKDSSGRLFVQRSPKVWTTRTLQGQPPPRIQPLPLSSSSSSSSDRNTRQGNRRTGRAEPVIERILQPRRRQTNLVFRS